MHPVLRLGIRVSKSLVRNSRRHSGGVARGLLSCKHCNSQKSRGNREERQSCMHLETPGGRSQTIFNVWRAARKNGTVILFRKTGKTHHCGQIPIHYRVNSVPRLTAILVLTLTCFRPAFAQVSYSPEHREWEVSGFLGGSFGGNFQFPTTVSGDSQGSSRTVGMHYASGYQIGMRVTQNLGDSWAAALHQSFAKHSKPFAQSQRPSRFLQRFVPSFVAQTAVPAVRYDGRRSRPVLHSRAFEERGIGAGIGAPRQLGICV